MSLTLAVGLIEEERGEYEKATANPLFAKYC
jgi:hypothetical protein